jgi:hypothetical protein
MYNEKTSQKIPKILIYSTSNKILKIIQKVLDKKKTSYQIAKTPFLKKNLTYFIKAKDFKNFSIDSVDYLIFVVTISYANKKNKLATLKKDFTILKKFLVNNSVKKTISLPIECEKKLADLYKSKLILVKSRKKTSIIFSGDLLGHKGNMLSLVFRNYSKKFPPELKAKKFVFTTKAKDLADKLVKNCFSLTQQKEDFAQYYRLRIDKIRPKLNLFKNNSGTGIDKTFFIKLAKPKKVNTPTNTQKKLVFQHKLATHSNRLKRLCALVLVFTLLYFAPQAHYMTGLHFLNYAINYPFTQKPLAKQALYFSNANANASVVLGGYYQKIIPVRNYDEFEILKKTTKYVIEIQNQTLQISDLFQFKNQIQKEQLKNINLNLNNQYLKNSFLLSEIKDRGGVQKPLARAVDLIENFNDVAYFSTKLEKENLDIFGIGKESNILFLFHDPGKPNLLED